MKIKRLIVTQEQAVQFLPSRILKDLWLSEIDFLGAFHDETDEMMAVVLFRRGREVIWLDYIAVIDKFRSEGVASELVNEILALYKTAGFVQCRISYTQNVDFPLREVMYFVRALGFEAENLNASYIEYCVDDILRSSVYQKNASRIQKTGKLKVASEVTMRQNRHFWERISERFGPQIESDKKADYRYYVFDIKDPMEISAYMEFIRKERNTYLLSCFCSLGKTGQEFPMLFMRILSLLKEQGAETIGFCSYTYQVTDALIKYFGVPKKNDDLYLFRKDL